MATAYEKLGLNSQAEIDKMVQGVDLSRYLPLFYKGYKDSNVLNQNPNASDAMIIEEMQKKGIPVSNNMNPDWKKRIIDTARQAEAANRVGVTEEEIKKPVAAIMASTAKLFKKQVGRDPSQAELSSLMNNITPDAMGSTVNLGSKVDLGDKADQVSESLARQFGLSDAISTLSPKFKVIDNANIGLKNLGMELPQDVVSKLLSSDTSPEEADAMAQTFLKSAKEGKVNDYLAGVPAQNEKMIGDFEKSLQNSQSEFFGGTLAKQIIAAMNARGITSGGLEDSLTNAAAGLQRDIQNTVAPIRLQAANDVTNKTYENILRGALEQGQTLDSAVNFARNVLTQSRQNQFTAGQADVQRAFQQDMFNQQAMLQMALGNASSNGPGALDYFLQYGLPVLGGIAGSFAGPIGAAIGAGAGGAGGAFARKNLTNPPVTGGGFNLRNSGYTPRNYGSYTRGY